MKALSPSIILSAVLVLMIAVPTPIAGSSHNLLRLPQVQADRLFMLLRDHNINLQFDLLVEQGTHQRLVLCSFRRGAENVLELMAANGTFEMVVNNLHTRVNNSPIADAQTHKIALVLTEQQLVLVDGCRLLFEMNIHGMDFVGRYSPAEKASVEIAFGEQLSVEGVQVGGISVDSGNPLESRCPSLSVNRSAIPGPETDFEKSLQPLAVAPNGRALADASERGEGDDLPERVKYLEYQMQHWNEVFKRFDHKIRRVEMHQRGCLINGRYLAVGERYRTLNDCTECQCSASGDLHCGRVGCPHLHCSHPIHQSGNCCPECGKRCFYSGRNYESGEEFWPKPCVQCRCENGKMECQYRLSRLAEACPKLNCPQQETPPNQCCPLCVNVDHCAMHPSPCHENASCRSGKHRAECKCKEGFFGNGTICYDVDECLYDTNAREQLGGCGIGTHCINLPGSFKCECRPGFQKLNDRNCLDVLRI